MKKLATTLLCGWVLWTGYHATHFQVEGVFEGKAQCDAAEKVTYKEQLARPKDGPGDVVFTQCLPAGLDPRVFLSGVAVKR
jgi:hypothetical protein